MVVKTEVCHLKTGDYTIKGYEEQITIERKNPGDLIGTISQERDRFERELARMEKMDWSCVMIEGDWKEVLWHCYISSDYNPVSLDSSILTFQMRYPKVHWIWRPNRYYAAKTAFKILDLFYRRIQCQK